MESIDAKLEAPIDTSDPSLQPFLGDLQGNILKGHGRRHVVLRFLRFDAAQAGVARATLAGLAGNGAITSSAKQLADTVAFRSDGTADIPVAFLMLSRAGYRALGVPSARTPGDPAFDAGMQSRSLGDPAPGSWDAHLSGSVHAVLLVGQESARGARDHVDRLSAGFAAAGITVLGDEVGAALFNAAGNGIEHFGYVDGRSQPLLLKSDEDHERSHGGAAHWDPAFSPLQTVLVRDPGSEHAHAFGSFFVFRKLEQNVRAFRRAERDLAAARGGSAEESGAMVVGRFRDGTPLAMSTSPTGGAVPNDFNYDADQEGRTCPFQAHIRKTNPRGDVKRQFQRPDLSDDRRPIMARRAIPYGQRSDDVVSDEGEKPTGGVGLLFMAYQRSFVDQFEFTQRSWANNVEFLRPGVGLDPVVGQGTASPQAWPAPLGSTQNVPFDFSGFVTMRGGEYFFAPSISTLAGLANHVPAIQDDPPGDLLG